MPYINQGYKDDVTGNVGPPLLFVETGTCTNANSFSEIECAQHNWSTSIISVCKHLWRKEKRKAIKSWMHCILFSTIGHTYFDILVAKVHKGGPKQWRYLFSKTYDSWWCYINELTNPFHFLMYVNNDILALIIFLSSFEVHQTCHGLFFLLRTNVQCILLCNFKIFTVACLDNPF